MFRTNMVIIMLATRKKRHIGTVVLGLRSHCLTNVTIYVTKVDRLGVKRVKIANNLRKLLIFYFFLYKYFEMLYFLYTRLVKNSKPVHICNFYHCYSQGHPPCVCVYIYIYTGCPRRNMPDFGRVFLMLKYTDITQNTYVQS